MKQTASTDYKDTITFDAPDISVTPGVCLNQAEHECSLESGSPYIGGEDLCNAMFSNGIYSTFSSFNTDSGEFAFRSTDIENIPDGVYLFKITTEIGEESVETFYEITLEDPCPDADLTANTDETDKFIDKQYVLRESSTITIAYDATDFFTTDAVVNCGAPVIEFIDEDDTLVYTE